MDQRRICECKVHGCAQATGGGRPLPLRTWREHQREDQQMNDMVPQQAKLIEIENELLRYISTPPDLPSLTFRNAIQDRSSLAGLLHSGPGSDQGASAIAIEYENWHLRSVSEIDAIIQTVPRLQQTASDLLNRLRGHHYSLVLRVLAYKEHQVQVRLVWVRVVSQRKRCRFSEE